MEWVLNAKARKQQRMQVLQAACVVYGKLFFCTHTHTPVTRILNWDVHCHDPGKLIHCQPQGKRDS